VRRTSACSFACQLTYATTAYTLPADTQSQESQYLRFGGWNWCALVRQKAGLGFLTAFDAARFADGAIVAEFRAVVARHAAVQCGAILGTGRCDEAGDGEEDQAACSSHISSRSDGRTQLRVAALFSRAAATAERAPSSAHGAALG